MNYDPMAEIQLDFDRKPRTGLEEAVFAEGKSVPQLDAIFETAEQRQCPLLVTRLDAEKHASLARRWGAHVDYCATSHTAFFGRVGTVGAAARIAVVAAGTSDARVAREAQRTLTFAGAASEMMFDVGVAGLWRLTRRIETLRTFPIIVAVAGMDAALPTVLGGLVPGLIIAVPTSVGYGVAAGGRTALNAILASCASGITVVNIDNGYGAACAALRVLRALQHTDRQETEQWNVETSSRQALRESP